MQGTSGFIAPLIEGGCDRRVLRRCGEQRLLDLPLEKVIPGSNSSLATDLACRAPINVQLFKSYGLGSNDRFQVCLRFSLCYSCRDPCFLSAVGQDFRA